jgi:hypothetical protein
MLSIDDALWDSLKGGYGTPFDPRPAIERLRTCGEDTTAWTELWNELHHQGDLGEASYVALVLLSQLPCTSELNFNQLFWLASTIEVERRRSTNPPIPAWLEVDYCRAMDALAELARTHLRTGVDREVAQGALAIVALASGNIRLGAAIWYHDDDTIRLFLDHALSWSELYRETPR